MSSVNWPYPSTTRLRAGSVRKAGSALAAWLFAVPLFAAPLRAAAQEPASTATEGSPLREVEPDGLVAQEGPEAVEDLAPTEDVQVEDVQVPRETAAVAARAPSLSLPSRARAADQPMFGTFEGTYGLGGMSTGVSFDGGGFLLGGELSIVRQTQEFAWFGGYIDGVYDFQRKQTRLSIGPELGWSAFGLDAGYLLALDDEGAHSGITARPLISIGYITAFGRVSHLFEDKRTWVEAGLLLKYPVEF